jgi:N-acyl-L-homoserine lactone synthetase
MSVRLKIAATTGEIDAVFRVRHRVFVEEEGYFQPRHDGRIADRFDSYPTTVNLVTAVDGRIVGTLRVVEETEAGSPTDEFFDFRPHLAGTFRFSSGSMFCVERAHRQTPRLVFALLAMGYHWSLSRGLNRMVGAVNPDVEGLFGRVGAKRIAAPVWKHDVGLGAIPMLIDLDELPRAFAAFLARQRVAPFPDSFERELLEPDEVLRCGGEARHTVYVVLDGHVAIERRGGRGRVGELGSGDWLSEVDLSPPERRSTRLRALSSAELMILDAGALEEIPAQARRRIGGTR